MGAAELLGPAGPFARTLAGYEARPSQLEMASAVERCLSSEGVLLIEAGTGTGKTLAYLVPALLGAGRKKVVISTATRALQDQIYYKDLPLALGILGLDIDVALMKGLPNYVCRRRHQEFRTSAESLQPEWGRSLPLVDAWLEESQTGAIEELASLAEDDPIWSRITASSERRIGLGCPHFERCHVTAMKRRAASARLLVVNHHLFFADLALRGAHPSSVLPDYDAVIFDEAHQIEEVATEHFGLSVSSARVARLVSDTARLLERQLGAAASEAQRIGQLGEALFDAVARVLPSNDGRSPLPPDLWAGEVEERWFALDTALEVLSGRIDVMCDALTAERRAGNQPGAENETEALFALVRRAGSLREDLASIARGMPGRVLWFESAARSRKLSASPVELSQILQERLFDVTPSVVLTSATLTSGAAPSAQAASSNNDASATRDRSVALDADPELAPQSWPDPDAPATPGARARGPFGFQRQRLGLTLDLYRVDELTLRSPFDFESQALLYLPDDLPSPDAPSFAAAAAERTRELIEMCDGGAFVLTTSVRSVHSMAQALKGRVGARRLCVQGEAPKARLLERFRNAGDAVLVATSSFWQGVDIPGAALRLVVLEKAPFPVPSDPILMARARALTLAGESPFQRLHLPLAQLALKQGFGRLIRSRSDYGVVALLDARVHRRGYGQRLLEGLPPARRVTALGDVAAFWTRFREASA
jgi:ATP-dependent DNA helicase DinG